MMTSGRPWPSRWCGWRGRRSAGGAAGLPDRRGVSTNRPRADPDRRSDHPSPGLMVPIEVTYDEFTVDIAENQILRTALRWMQGVPRLSDSARASLGHLDGQARRGQHRRTWAAAPRVASRSAQCPLRPCTAAGRDRAGQPLSRRAGRRGYRWPPSSSTWPRSTRTSSGQP